MAEAIPEPTAAANGNGVSESDSKSRLEDLTAQATAKYAIKDYRAAAELYSRATELQAEINGEMSTQNADLLYYYGRCLYHVALMGSDVLGSKVAGERQEQTAKKPKDQVNKGPVPSTSQSRIDEEAVAIIAEEKGGEQVLERKDDVLNKPYFTFTGDENFDDSDEEDAEGEGNAEDGPAEEEEDEFGNAFEVLDLARVLLQRKLEEEVDDQEGKGKAIGDSESAKQLKERLADTHDLQAEISLEGEQFPNAVGDLRTALGLKQELFPKHSSLIAEAHYKLSLALEFSSVTQQKDENGQIDETKIAHVDEAMREEAAKEMESAIESCKIRVEREEAALKSNEDIPKDASGKFKVTRESIDDVKEMVKDMEQRLVELRQPPVSINDPTGTGSIDGANALSGILGSILGESPEEKKARLEQATREANDLTNLVKRKKPAGNKTQEREPSPTKRKVDELEEVETPQTDKRARVEDAEDE